MAFYVQYRYLRYLAESLIILFSVGYLIADPVVPIAKGFLYVREKGYNRSPEIDTWNSFTEVDMGSPYCASFVSYMNHLAGIKAPVSAYAPDQVKRNNVPFSQIKTGDIFGIYFPSKGRVAHVGFVEQVKGSYLLTVEANTSPDAKAGSSSDRDGEGVYARRRPVYLMKQQNNKYSHYE